MKTPCNIAIIGGGVAGTTAALKLSGRGARVTLFEKAPDISSGPPYCHLHAGGNLYRDISDEQCIALLRQSIAFVRAYPYAIDRRPTVITVPKTDPDTPRKLLPRLQKLKNAYARHIADDPANAVLGPGRDYYMLYDEARAAELAKRVPVTEPATPDEWMVSALRQLDLNTLQFPLVLVQEYGINLFRFAAGATQQLEACDDVTLQMQTAVTSVESCGDRWKLHFENEEGQQCQAFDYLINACGFRTGTVDDMVGVQAERMVEFKASYIARHSGYQNAMLPEIIIHGERGTPRGMAQFTPYPGGYFQLHGMTADITLYEEGLAASTRDTAQPELNRAFVEKLDRAWPAEEVALRTRNAIGHVAQYLPAFAEADVGAGPLFGAQQIPGTDPSLRVAEVAFPRPGYARCEIVKVSSALDMAEAIVRRLFEEGRIGARDDAHPAAANIAVNDDDITAAASGIALRRSFPASMAELNVRAHDTKQRETYVQDIAV